MFWTGGHCGRDGISRVMVLLQSREPSAPTECVPEVLKQFATPKGEVEERYGVVATSESGQLTKSEVRLSGCITGKTVSGHCELVPWGCIASNL